MRERRRRKMEKMIVYFVGQMNDDSTDCRLSGSARQLQYHPPVSARINYPSRLRDSRVRNEKKGRVEGACGTPGCADRRIYNVTNLKKESFVTLGFPIPVTVTPISQISSIFLLILKNRLHLTRTRNPGVKTV